jgi:hypothetical protein
MPGPAPKRDEERRRRNKPTTETIKVNLDETLAGEIEIPAPDEDWHPIAIRWYMSLTKSGQSIFYEPSDWETAYVLAETLSRELLPHETRVGEEEFIEVVDNPLDREEGESMILKGRRYLFEDKPQTMSAATLTAWLKGASALMTTEAERRRLKIELDRKAKQDAIIEGGGKVIDIVQRRAELFAEATRA